MRSSDQQDDFLQHGRFGEGPQTLSRRRVHPPLWIGLVCFGAAAIFVGVIKVFQIGGHDVGGLDLLYASILAVAVGVIFSIAGLFQMRSR
jgi:hypothetical protein